MRSYGAVAGLFMLCALAFFLVWMIVERDYHATGTVVVVGVVVMILYFAVRR